MKKFSFALLWFMVLSFSCLFLGGLIVGAIAGNSDPANSTAAGAAAGQAFSEKYTGRIFLLTLVTVSIGTLNGWLPGTKSTTEAD
ncbi:MAG: hypothetical protein KUG79_01910 [Pseudomonadales bacterium]|nr:hypothetical protein [Pseudomonadales bacterium]